MDTADIRGLREGGGFPNLVAFKWLMAGVGWWVDLPRLQSDMTYMDICLQRALRSDSQLLQKRSVEMLGLPRSSDVHCDVPSRADSTSDFRKAAR